jgi:hypothetical protein
MLARMLRKILLFQATFLALFSAAIAGFAGWPAWAGLLIFSLLPMALVSAWMLKVTVHACRSGSPWRDVIYASLGEAFWIYRFFVTRMPWAWQPPKLQAAQGPQAGIGVVLVHGFVCNHRVWDDLARYLRAHGHAVFAIDLEPVFASIDKYADTIEEAVQSLRQHTGQSHVALVGHSMGGLAIRAWMRAHGTGHAAVAVTLGTPHQGTQVSPRAKAPNGKQMVYQSAWLAALAADESAATRGLFRIAITPQDAIVFPQREQVLPGTVAQLFDGKGHVQLCSNAEVMRWVAEQLANPPA